MQCPGCQRDSPAAAKFCEHCGAPLRRRCTNCGTTLSASARFCAECGRAVDAPSAVAGRFLSPESYTPRHLAERILTSKTALEGERKQVTVLFADVKGSMELLIDRDPEEARAILDPVLELMMEAVHRYEGTVNQVMGDGIMALFGAPLAHEDHAVRGCYAALRMQVAVKRHAEALFRSHGVPIQIRVGLNSGEVVVRAIASDLRMDYSAVGQTTHLAARMEQLALPGSIRLTAHTLRLAEGRLQVNALGPIPIKGLPDPVEVFELVDASAGRPRLQAAAGGLTPFVGRTPELAVLQRALEKAGAGRGQVVAVTGEPGVGKSRLVLELTRSGGASGWLILQASAVSYGAATGLMPAVDLLRGYFQIEERDRGRRLREKINSKLVALDESLLASVPAFLALLDVAFEDARWQALDPRERRRQTLDACRRLLLRESQVQPLLLVFEDLHWVDSETQALLDALVGSLVGARILLLVDYRPEYRHDWAGKTYYTQVRVDPLAAVSADELLRTLLGTDASLEPLKRLLIDRTGGNPFFLEESVKTLIETTVLAGDRGAYRAVQPLDSVAVPATVRAVLAARIDRLSPEVKRLLQSASAIGNDVPFSLLRAVAEDTDDELRRHLAQLQAGEFLYERTLFPDVEYTFNHALTQDVAYGSLLQERRRTLHAQIMTALEPLAAEQPDRLAHHALRGEVWDKAIGYLRQAGTRATARSAYREAVTCFEQALGALAHLPRSRDTMAAAIDLRLDLRTALTPLGQYRRILDLLGEAEAIAGDLQDDVRLGHVVSRGDPGHASSGSPSKIRNTRACSPILMGSAAGIAPATGRHSSPARGLPLFHREGAGSHIDDRGGGDDKTDQRRPYPGLRPGLFYLVTGVWPLLSMRTFEMVTGPKTDRWLVKTVGALLGVIGASLMRASTRRRAVEEVGLLGPATAATLATVDVMYAAPRRIPGSTSWTPSSRSPWSAPGWRCAGPTAEHGDSHGLSNPVLARAVGVTIPGPGDPGSRQSSASQTSWSFWLE